MANDCLLEVDVGLPATVTADVLSSTTITADIASPSTITADVSIPTTVTADILSATTITADILQSTTIDVAIVQPSTITVQVLDMSTVSEALLNSIEEGAQREHRDAKKLTAWTTSINIPNATPVELPSGLVSYPTFRDSGYIEITCGAAHANMNGGTVSFDLRVGPSGSPLTVATFTSAAFGAGAGNFQFEFLIRIKSQGQTSQNYFARMVYNEPGPLTTTKDFIGRITTLDFGNVSNGDNGDVEIRLDAYLPGGAGPTFNVRNMNIMQFAGRSGSQ